MTAALTTPDLTAQISGILGAFAAEPHPSLDLEARSLLEGNPKALRSWADFSNAVWILIDLETSSCPWLFLPEDEQGLGPEDAEVRAQQNWTNEREAAREALLRAVAG
jgi:hypothetical protein